MLYEVEIILDNSINGNTTFSLIEHPDIAVTIYIVVEDIYKSNLTTQQEATQIIDDVVKILILSSELDTDTIINTSWTELATIKQITSNEDIINTNTTTTGKFS